jgi:glycine cleavage system transcriptional repressor
LKSDRLGASLIFVIKIMVNSRIHFLAVSLLGPISADLWVQLSLSAKQNCCNIKKSKLTNLGGELAGSLYFSGNWNSIAKLEVQLPKIAKKYNLSISLSRTIEEEPSKLIPYKVQILAGERVGIVHDLINFFWKRNITVQYLNCDTFYPTPGCNMNKISLGILLSVKENIASLRDSFMTHCDDKNLDAYFECDYLSN